MKSEVKLRTCAWWLELEKRRRLKLQRTRSSRFREQKSGSILDFLGTRSRFEGSQCWRKNHARNVYANLFHFQPFFGCEPAAHSWKLGLCGRPQNKGRDDQAAKNTSGHRARFRELIFDRWIVLFRNVLLNLNFYQGDSQNFIIVFLRNLRRFYCF